MLFHNCNGKANKKITPKEDAVMQWRTQAGSITNNLKIKIDFTLPELTQQKSRVGIIMWMIMLKADMI